MLTTFVIALREGLEASLIVGIVAAFLARRAGPPALRAMWAGVALAIVLCLAVAVALRVVDEQLPRHGQEGLEAVVALIAVAMVTYMIAWMAGHARDLRGRLHEQAEGALAKGSIWALVAMAFVAVLREGSRPRSSCWRPSTTRPIPSRPASAWCSASPPPSRSAPRSTVAACA